VDALIALYANEARHTSPKLRASQLPVALDVQPRLRERRHVSVEGGLGLIGWAVFSNRAGAAAGGLLPALFSIVNDAAQAYKGVIPADCWHEPYMPLDQLKREIGDDIAFRGCEAGGTLVGMMGIQDRSEVSLIRHAYVQTAQRRKGIGEKLLKHLEGITAKPILIGTWSAAAWAIRFYEKNGYRALSRPETERLLHKYWSIPERQIIGPSVKRPSTSSPI
jgi:GNAT superfamily N-acetyltransferase